MKILKYLGMGLLVVIVLVMVLIMLMSFKPFVPNHYTKKVKTGNEIEAKYLEMGDDKVEDIKIEGSELTKFYSIYYPKELEMNDKKYPVVVVLNGTGVLPKKYKALFKHLASWGFIVIGSDDGSSGFGQSADETIEFLLNVDSDKHSVFFKKIDLENIGITGHSQGGAGVFTATSVMKYKDNYKTAVALSPTHEAMAYEFGWNYDLTQINTPTLMMSGTIGEFETEMVIPLEKMLEMYVKIPSSKVMARRIDAEHGQMLYRADGYVTAWLMWQLQNDSYASKAFIGDNPELLNNELYVDVNIDYSK